jgi:CubicO group peptidase (beta-lactamase class C family)
VDFPRSTFFHGGGGVEASPQDFLRFAQIFLHGGSSGGVGLLEPETIDRMMTDQLGDLAPRAGWSWGYGAALQFSEDAAGSRTLRQYGWIGGGYAIAWVDPVDRLVAYFAFGARPTARRSTRRARSRGFRPGSDRAPSRPRPVARSPAGGR